MRNFPARCHQGLFASSTITRIGSEPALAAVAAPGPRPQREGPGEAIRASPPFPRALPVKRAVTRCVGERKGLEGDGVSVAVGMVVPVAVDARGGVAARSGVEVVAAAVPYASACPAPGVATPARTSALLLGAALTLASAGPTASDKVEPGRLPK